MWRAVLLVFLQVCQGRDWGEYERARRDISWQEVDASEVLFSRGVDTTELKVPCTVKADAVMASSLLDTAVPVYISIATISARVKDIALIVCDLITGNVVPDYIFVVISSSPFLLDLGVSPADLPVPLLALAAMTHDLRPKSLYLNISSSHKNYSNNAALSDTINSLSVNVRVVQTNCSLGPHRKLLPLLSQQWTQDVVILIIDDDIRVVPSYLQKFIELDHLHKGQTIIAGTVRRLGLCYDQSIISPGLSDVSSLPYKHWTQVKRCDRELLTLPVGRGSVLYRPKFFHPVVFDSKLRRLTYSNDDLTFRLATLIKRIPVTLLHSSISLRSAIDPSQHLRANATSLFHQRNRATNNYSNILQWQAGVNYVESLHLLDYSSLVLDHVIIEREWFCSSNSLIFRFLRFKQCALGYRCDSDSKKWSTVSLDLENQVFFFYVLSASLLLLIFRGRIWYATKHFMYAFLSVCFGDM